MFQGGLRSKLEVWEVLLNSILDLVGGGSSLDSGDGRGPP